MNGQGYRDRTGKPITVLEWAALWKDFEGYRVVARTMISDRLYVITVWSGVVSPVIEGLFFTGVFDSSVKKLIEEIPTDTEAEALAVHERTVARLQA